MGHPQQYFILVYDVDSHALEVHDEFAGDHEMAALCYSELEEEHRDDQNIEVVLVGADSIETIKKTHSHYFIEQAEDIFRQFLEETIQPA